MAPVKHDFRSESHAFHGTTFLSRKVVTHTPLVLGSAVILTLSLRNTCFTCFLRMHGFHCENRVSQAPFIATARSQLSMYLPGVLSRNMHAITHC